MPGKPPMTEASDLLALAEERAKTLSVAQSNWLDHVANAPTPFDVRRPRGQVAMLAMGRGLTTWWCEFPDGERLLGDYDPDSTSLRYGEVLTPLGHAVRAVSRSRAVP